MIFLLLGWFCKIFSVDNFQISYFKIFHKLYETKMWQAECLYWVITKMQSLEGACEEGEVSIELVTSQTFLKSIIIT